LRFLQWGSEEPSYTLQLLKKRTVCCLKMSESGYTASYPRRTEKKKQVDMSVTGDCYSFSGVGRRVHVFLGSNN
jgi:hypothetical protein